MLLSVITINYNNAPGLKNTIESVINQAFDDFEYMVIDGGSTDGSVEVIKYYEKHISYWISEPDEGIYNAMNKGIAQASGKYLLMINSGDFLVNEQVFDSVFRERDLKDINYGDILWNDNGRKYKEVFADQVTFSYFRSRSLGHQAVFVRKSVHDIAGLYDETYEIVSDWKFLLLAICKYNISYRHIPIIIAECGRDGISCRPENEQKILSERCDVLQKNFSAYIPDYERMDLAESQFNQLSRTLPVRIARKLNSIFKINRRSNEG